ncbi:pentatricopeptide repeat-containing protein At5g10690 isoform X1 [Cucurbita moschata]|uniref:Pentatricopeptide repeat-containing protein At5g10690 isoform X1 n=1 Tax=Cucurbita moschata TaxID=3662 RepID=A0A6J1FEL4_CUCMO|nr:pentatricopeptide repeat-containing protein At5g10690 isoform X1 [Cucurbita moschata]
MLWIVSFSSRHLAWNPSDSMNVFSCSLPSRTADARRRIDSPRSPNLKRLTSRVVRLTRRKQLHQIFEEIEIAKRRYGKLNTIVMNAVLEACVHCGDIDLALRTFNEMSKPDNCGLDNVSYGTLLKGLGEARKIDEAFQLLESVEEGTAIGSPTLSAPLIYGVLNALTEAGDMRRANGLIARYGFLLHEGGNLSISVYNLLMKGYISSGVPQAALALYNEMLNLELKPDKLTYNTLISACVKINKLDAAMYFFEEMKERAGKYNQEDIFPDVVTYTTLLKGFGILKDVRLVHKIVLEMKTCHDLLIDRTAYTAMIDALVNCGSINGALSLFGELLKLSGWYLDLRPKPHLYLTFMRFFSSRGDYTMVKCLHRRMWLDSSGSISPGFQEEADHLLMEAALHDNQIDVATEKLSTIIKRWKGISWSSRGGSVALRIEALLGLTKSFFSPCIFPRVNPGAPIESVMMPFKAVQPLNGNLQLKEVVMRFFDKSVVPIIDDWGRCIGLLHREDCSELEAPLWKMMRSPPPGVTTTTSIGHVVNLILRKRYKMIIIVRYSKFSTYDSSSSRAVGVFTIEQLYGFISPFPIQLQPNIPHKT